MRRLLPLLTFSLLLLSACDNPTSVGRDLINEGSDQVDRVALSPTSVAQRDSLTLVTGADRSASPLRRVLTGHVNDPPFGGANATGYMDFSIGPTAIPDSVSLQNVSVKLKLVRDYLYGDTTQALSVQLRNMPEDWDPRGATADTSLEAGMKVDEYTVNPGDSLISLRLPDAWVAQRESALRDTTLDEQFSGFQISALSAGNAILGFNYASSRLQIETPGDTTAVQLKKTLTSLSRSASSSLQNRLLVQNGIGPEATFRFDFTGSHETTAGKMIDLLGAIPNRAALVLQADTSHPAPAGFVRPQLQALDLYAQSADGQEARLVARAFRDDQGRFALTSNNLLRRVRGVLQDQATLTRIRVGPGLTRRFSSGVTRPVSVTPAALYAPTERHCSSGNDDCKPSFDLTLTRTQ